MVITQNNRVEIHQVTDDVIHTSRGQVNKKDFEDWLQANDLLEWSHDTSNYRGEHDQKLGQFTIEEYYTTPYIASDLFNYINISK